MFPFFEERFGALEPALTRDIYIPRSQVLDWRTDPWGWHDTQWKATSMPAAGSSDTAVSPPQQSGALQEWDRFEKAVARQLREGGIKGHSATTQRGHCVFIDSLSTLLTRHSGPQVRTKPCT